MSGGRGEGEEEGDVHCICVATLNCEWGGGEEEEEEEGDVHCICVASHVLLGLRIHWFSTKFRGFFFH